MSKSLIYKGYRVCFWKDDDGLRRICACAGCDWYIDFLQATKLIGLHLPGIPYHWLPGIVGKGDIVLGKHRLWHLNRLYGRFNLIKGSSN